MGGGYSRLEPGIGRIGRRRVDGGLSCVCNAEVVRYGSSEHGVAPARPATVDMTGGIIYLT